MSKTLAFLLWFFIPIFGSLIVCGARRGTGSFFINLILLLLGIIPGLIHSLVVAVSDNDEERKDRLQKDMMFQKIMSEDK